MAEDQPKVKRHLRPSTTVRQETAKAKIVQVKRPSWLKRIFRPIARKLNFLFRPIRWLGRHLIPRYIRGAFSELRQVTWPDRKQSRQLTIAVIMFATIFGIVIALLDYGLDKAFKKVFLHE